MYKDYKELYTSEWFVAVEPTQLLPSTISVLKLLTDYIDKVPTEYRRISVAKSLQGYKLLDVNIDKDVEGINKSDVIWNYPKAGETIVAGSTTVIGLKGVESEYHFFWKTTISNIFLIGDSFTKETAIQGRDFTPTDGGYLFKEHPSRYMTTYLDEGVTKCLAIVRVNKLVNHIRPYTVYNSDNVNTSKNIENITSVFTPIGVSRFLHDITEDSYVKDNLGATIVDMWVEQDMMFAITTTGDFISAHKDSKYTFKDKVELKKTTKTIIFPLEGKYYSTSQQTNVTEAFPNILEVYPSLSVYSDNKFLLSSLYNILVNDGCNFITCDYIKNENNKNTKNNFSASSHTMLSDKVYTLDKITKDVKIVYKEESQITEVIN